MGESSALGLDALLSKNAVECWSESRENAVEYV